VTKDPLGGWLVRDSNYHRGEAVRLGIEKGYIVVAAYRTADQKEPALWLKQIEKVLDAE
jgi:hypothetical protein